MATIDLWDARFLRMAQLISTWSKDPSTKTGAVITRGKRIVSLGYNGLPKGLEDKDQRLTDRSIKYEMIVHAEMNAMAFAQQSLNGCNLYTWPIPPCSRCMSLVIQHGIGRIVAPTKDPDARWKQSCEMGKMMYAEATSGSQIWHQMEVIEQAFREYGL